MCDASGRRRGKAATSFRNFPTTHPTWIALIRSIKCAHGASPRLELRICGPGEPVNVDKAYVWTLQIFSDRQSISRTRVGLREEDISDPQDVSLHLMRIDGREGR